MEDAVTYANQRIAFNKPIANFQMTQEKLTEMEIRLQNTRNMLYKTLWELDKDISVQLDSALLKRYGCTECFNVADMALSIFGGIGYTTEVRVGRIDVYKRQHYTQTKNIMINLGEEPSGFYPAK